MAKIIEINDINAPEIAPYLDLKSSKLKEEREIFIVESVKVIKTAIECGISPQSFLMEKRQIEGIGRELIESFPDVPVFVSQRETLSRLTGFELTRGVLAAFYCPKMQDINEILKKSKRIAVLERLSDSVNVGAIFRSAAALGMDAVLLFNNCSQPLNRRSVRVSMGTVFQIPWAFFESDITAVEVLKQNGFKIGSVETSRKDYISGVCAVSTTSRYRVGQVLFTQVSRPLKEIIREINVESNNHYSEHLIRTIGRQYKADIYDNALEAGIEFVVDYWKRKGVDITPVTMHDGSGLAPQNAVSSEFLADMLSYMYNKSSYSAAFINSLPKAGQDGTLRNFMTNTRYNGKIIAKSGSIGGVHCYAGYLIDGEKRYAFSVMINKFNGTRAQVRGAIEQFLLSL